MKIKITATRTKIDNEIHERFTIDPNSKFFKDNKRAIYYKIINERNRMSLHKKGFILDRLFYYEDFSLYIYNYDATKEVPLLTEEKTINYYPVMGKKTCKKCKNKIGCYCIMKGIKIEKYSFYRCLYWTEKECI